MYHSRYLRLFRSGSGSQWNHAFDDFCDCDYVRTDGGSYIYPSYNGEHPLICQLHILTEQIVVGVSKAIGSRFGNGGIADRMIWANGFPYLDSKGDHVFNVPVSHAMTAEARTLPASDFPVREAEHLLSDNKFQGFPIVENRTSKILVGYIGRTELRYAIDRARSQGIVSPNARCIFTKEAVENSVGRRASVPQHLAPETFDAIETSTGARHIDFSRYVEHTPLSVHPRLPLETVMEIFKKMGPRVILVEHRGRLTGLVTVKDCLKYQFKAEAEEQALAASEVPLGRPLRTTDSLEDRVWNLMQRIAKKVPWLFPTQGSVQLTGTESREESRILDGTEDSHVELEER